MTDATPLPIDVVPPSWTTNFLYMATRFSGATFFTLASSLRFEGIKNVPSHGPALLVSNHQSFLDPPLIGQAIPRQLVYLARKTLFKNPALGGLIRGLNAVPIDQDGVGKDGIRTILDQLRLGKAVLVFPEGTRTPDGEIKEFKAGIHLLIKRTEAPIIPIGVAGVYEAWPSWRKYPLLSPLFLPPTNRTVAMSIGKPLDPRRFAQMPREEAMLALRDEIATMHARAEKMRRK